MNKKETEMGKESIESDATGIVAELGALGPGALVFESGLARMLGRHPVSIKRAVERGELPPPVRLLGQLVWLVETIIEFLRMRLAEAAKEAKKREEMEKDREP